MVAGFLLVSPTLFHVLAIRTAAKTCDYARQINPMRAQLIRILYALLTLLAIVYGYDFASVHHRARAQEPGDPFDVVTYPHLLAIPQKGNKVDYELDAQSPMESVACVHSLFPHYGYTPCWYVLRRSKSPTQMTILAPVFHLQFVRCLSGTGFAMRANSAKLLDFHLAAS